MVVVSLPSFGPYSAILFFLCLACSVDDTVLSVHPHIGFQTNLPNHSIGTSGSTKSLRRNVLPPTFGHALRHRASLDHPHHNPLATND